MNPAAPATNELRRIWDGSRQKSDEVFALCASFEAELRELKAEIAERLGLKSFPDDLEAAFETFAGRCTQEGSATAAYWKAEADRARREAGYWQNRRAGGECF